MRTVEIGIPTFKRPEALTALLSSLSNLSIPLECRVHLIVVDNDKLESARSAVEQYARVSPFPVHYYCESEAGVGNVRNRILSLARGDYIAMIDDDQTATPEWLVNILNAAEKTGADAVIGSVRQDFPANAPKWVLEMSGRKAIPDHSRLTNGGSNNILLRRQFIEDIGLRFNPEFNFSGGEDTDFFARLHSLNGKIYSSAGALLIEPIDPARVSFGWYAMRNFRVGQTNFIVFGKPKSLLTKFVACTLRFAAGIACCVLGTIMFPLFNKIGATVFLTGVRNIGYVSAFTSMRALEYQSK